MKQPEIPVEVYVVKLTLVGTNPIWRRILVPRDSTLHRTLQTVMGWANSHLHQFVVQRHRISDPKSRVGTKVANGVDLDGGAEPLYEYGFEDGWQHELPLEEVLLGDETRQLRSLRAKGRW